MRSVPMAGSRKPSADLPWAPILSSLRFRSSVASLTAFWCEKLRSSTAPASESRDFARRALAKSRSEEHTSELQSRFDLVCRLLLEKKKKVNCYITYVVQ